MVNGSFVFGMDGDDASVFERTVEWAIEQGIETATFHILTPYPGHGAATRGMAAQGRITTDDWDLYDTRHAVFRPARMSGDAARSRLLARLSRLLPLGIDRARRVGARPTLIARPAPRGVRGRLEEVRAAVGSRDPREAGRR